IAPAGGTSTLARPRPASLVRLERVLTPGLLPMTTNMPLSGPQKLPLKVLLCSPRGFCGGVVRAIDTVERALALHGPPVYVRHEIVHNRYVVDGLRAKGAIFVESLDEIPDTTAPVVFSAHGVPKSVPDEAIR